MRLYIEKLRGWVNPSDAFIAMFAQEQNAFWLDRSTNKDEAVSVMGAAGSVLRLGEEVFQKTNEHLARLLKSIQNPDLDLHFGYRPGLVGYLGYELSESAGESTNPRAQFLIAERVLVFDHNSKEMFFLGLFESEADFREWIKAALLRLALVGGEQAAFLAKAPTPKIISTRLRSTPESYLDLIRKAKDFIAKGDVYQLCLTNQIFIECEASPLRVFLELKETNPAPYSSYLKISGLEIVSSSPEQFLKISNQGLVSTKPIKGTRPRNLDPNLDQEIRLELSNNEKERAENLMIVDLMRNDLARVCEPESISVDSLFEVESYATVHQLVSKVTGKLRPGFSSSAAIASCFPGGSMTGAPKIRAMEILRDLEESSRGIYSGAIGYLGFDGAVDLGMTIRTLVFEGNWATLGVGGGITIDSDPIAELEETMLKAKALMKSLGGESWKI